MLNKKTAEMPVALFVQQASADLVPF